MCVHHTILFTILCTQFMTNKLGILDLVFTILSLTLLSITSVVCVHHTILFTILCTQFMTNKLGILDPVFTILSLTLLSITSTQKKKH